MGSPSTRDFQDGARGAGIFECDPARTTYEFEFNEIIYTIEGRARIELETGSAVDLEPGDMAFLPKGSVHLDVPHRFREFWVLTD